MPETKFKHSPVPKIYFDHSKDKFTESLGYTGEDFAIFLKRAVTALSFEKNSMSIEYLHSEAKNNQELIISICIFFEVKNLASNPLELMKMMLHGK